MRAAGREGASAILHHRDQGSGAAVRAGFERAIGDIPLIQDGDPGYDARDDPAALLPFEEGKPVMRRDGPRDA